ncbi:MAG: hypothetical protein HRT61_07210 [Ekhidna sp.]|nr:hypothetical protein [Ekhidna sp.]
MKTKNLLFLLITLFIFSGCGDDDSVNCDFDETPASVDAAFDAYFEALSDYSRDPSEANCNAYAAAIDRYIAEFGPYTSCPDAGEGVQADIASKEQQKRDLSCN